jgi:hypothetical protein
MICRDCGLDKPESDFYAHPGMVSGVLGSCKEYKKSYQRSYRCFKMQYPKLVEKERKRNRIYMLGCYQTRTKFYRQANPEKYKAHDALNNALRDGRVIKHLNCEQCDQ